MKNKIIKLLIICFVFLSAFFIFSCNSNSFPVPNQNKIIQDNIYKEYLALGDAYFDIERYNDAISYYKKCVSDKSLRKVAEYKIGKCYCLLSDWSNALPVFEKLLEEDSDNMSLKSSMAYIYSMNGNLDEALSCYKELLLNEENNITFIENCLGVILSSKDFFLKNRDYFEPLFNNLKEIDSKNKNIGILQQKYEDYIKEENK